MTNERLKNYLDTTKHESILMGPVDRHLQLKSNDRDPTVIHPSEMASKDWCHRATWHRLVGHTLHKPPAPERLRPNLIFGEGHIIHTKWQKWLTEIGCLWGQWACLICDTWCVGWADAIGEMCPALEGTPYAKPHRWVYEEVPLELLTHRIGGRADGIVNPTGDEAVLLEIKSVGPGTMRRLDLIAEHESDDISADRFSKITRPMNSHFLQTQMYLRLSDQWSEQVGKVDRAVVLYEHKPDQQVREFVITRNNRWTDHLFEAAADIVWAIDNDHEVKCNHQRGGCDSCHAYEESV